MRSGPINTFAQDIYTILEVEKSEIVELTLSFNLTLVLDAAQTCVAFPSAEAICSTCLSDRTCLNHKLLTYKGFRQAKGMGCNWCQRGAKRQ